MDRESPGAPSDSTAQDLTDAPCECYALADTVMEGESGIFKTASPRAWWGSYALDRGEAGRWVLGALNLWARHLDHEWKLSWVTSGDAQTTSIEVDCPTDRSEPDEASVQRIALKDPPRDLGLQPALADRSVVVRPAKPLTILAGDEVRIYVSTPLWVRVMCGEAARQLFELPTFRPSDTWFGASPTAGELCYASRTSARLVQEEMLFHPLRALTAITIENHSGQSLMLDRINLPVPYLSLYLDQRLSLWTQEVTIERETDGTTARVQLESEPPGWLRGPQLLTKPRQSTSRNVFVRAYDALLG